MTRKTEKEDGVKLASRFEHMALIVKLDEKWFLCDGVEFVSLVLLTWIILPKPRISRSGVLLRQKKL